VAIVALWPIACFPFRQNCREFDNDSFCGLKIDFVARRKFFSARRRFLSLGAFLPWARRLDFWLISRASLYLSLSAGALKLAWEITVWRAGRMAGVSGKIKKSGSRFYFDDAGIFLSLSELDK
jgi:hypothetical protein